MNALRAWGVVAAAIVLMAFPSYKALRWLDDYLLSERLKDMFGSLTTDEDWSVVESARLLPLDYAWLTATSNPLRVAHALGAAGSADADTMRALDVAANRGFVLFEVDLWLDVAGVVRCHHGPGAPDPRNDCTADRLAERDMPKAYWVLDIKTDFELTGSKVLAAFAARGRTDRLIFQLYRPADIEVFRRWQMLYPLAGPIVTMYETHRSLGHVAEHVARAGIRVVTVPLDRAAVLGRRPHDMRLLVHPVHDCRSWQKASSLGVDGVYTVSRLDCTHG